MTAISLSTATVSGLTFNRRAGMKVLFLTEGSLVVTATEGRRNLSEKGEAF